MIWKVDLNPLYQSTRYHRLYPTLVPTGKGTWVERDSTGSGTGRQGTSSCPGEDRGVVQDGDPRWSRPSPPPSRDPSSPLPDPCGKLDLQGPSTPSPDGSPTLLPLNPKEGLTLTRDGTGLFFSASSTGTEHWRLVHQGTPVGLVHQGTPVGPVSRTVG